MNHYDIVITGPHYKKAISFDEVIAHHIREAHLKELKEKLRKYMTITKS